MLIAATIFVVIVLALIIMAVMEGKGMAVFRRQGPSEEDKRRLKEEIDTKPCLQSLGKTYYVVERFDRYVDGVYSFFASEEPYEKTVRTTDSLLECDRYETYEQAKEFADKYNCNVRKVIVKVEE
ncbi:hypothetical protein [Mammaliicoccus sciuri]|uniref:hypothetical protein n=1 Tax=Mammaliicoccus sciuri TaxID=1296 RepID=UPI0027378CB3|nr:hypothetical protein [Mammaliicoccus sciuri]